jgi:hypothetical protein
VRTVNADVSFVEVMFICPGCMEPHTVRLERGSNKGALKGQVLVPCGAKIEAKGIVSQVNR